MSNECQNQRNLACLCLECQNQRNRMSRDTPLYLNRTVWKQHEATKAASTDTFLFEYPQTTQEQDEHGRIQGSFRSFRKLPGGGGGGGKYKKLTNDWVFSCSHWVEIRNDSVIYQKKSQKFKWFPETTETNLDPPVTRVRRIHGWIPMLLPQWSSVLVV